MTQWTCDHIPPRCSFRPLPPPNWNCPFPPCCVFCALTFLNNRWCMTKRTITLWVQILRIRVVIIQKKRHSRAYQERNILLCHFPSWLEERKLLSFFTLLFHKQTNTDMLFLKHRPSSDPTSLPVSILFLSLYFSLPSFPSSPLFLSLSPSHRLTPLSPL